MTVLSGRRMSIASFPKGMANNPYGRLLYGALAELGYDRVEGGRLEGRWLWRNRQEVQWLHIHWDELEYESEHGGPAASWLALARAVPRGDHAHSPAEWHRGREEAHSLLTVLLR